MRKHNYVVGYVGENECVYGNVYKGPDGIEFNRFTNPMTIFQARKKLKQLKSKCRKAIYKLVRVKP